jgi:hypothetical protein
MRTIDKAGPRTSDRCLRVEHGHATCAANNQLMSKRRVFSFKPQLRLEWRGQDGQSEQSSPIISLVEAIPLHYQLG